MSDRQQLAAPPGKNAVPIDVSAVPPGFEPTARHLAYARAVAELAEAGKMPSDGNVARVLQVSRYTVLNWRKRWPFLAAWAGELLRREAGHLVGPIIVRLGKRALERASVSHAELFLRATGHLADSSSGARAPIVQVNVVGGLAPAQPAGEKWAGGRMDDAKV